MLRLEELGYKQDKELSCNARVAFAKEYKHIAGASQVIYINKEKRMVQTYLVLNSKTVNVPFTFDEIGAVEEYIKKFCIR